MHFTQFPSVSNLIIREQKQQIQQNFLQTGVSDINTKRIYINKKGTIKVAPYMQAQSDIDSFKRAGFFNENGYLAPECLEKLKKRDILSSINFNKNDVFGLGMSILEMTSLKSSAELYDWEKYLIKQDLLEDRLNEAKQRFGTYLQLFLQKLLEKDIDKRSTFSQLFQELLPYQQQIITGVGFKDISIFKGNPNQQDPGTQKTESENLHSKQESSVSLQSNQFGKVSSYPSGYSSSEKSGSISFQQQHSIAQPSSFHINQSPLKAQSQSFVQQQQKEYVKFKTEESDISFINKGQTSFDMSYYPNNNYSQFTVNTNNVSSTTNQSLQNHQLQNQDGYNSYRNKNSLIHRPCNFNTPYNPDQRSLSPSPVIHQQINHQFNPSFHQQSPIKQKDEQKFQDNQPHQQNQGQTYQSQPQQPEKDGFTYNSNGIQDNRSTSQPIKKLILNNIVNPNINVKNIVYQQNPPNNKIIFKNNISQPGYNNLSQENVFTGNTFLKQPIEKNIITTQIKSPQIQMNIPVNRTNKNMIINQIALHNRSVSPQHFMVQRSLTPTIRTSFTNKIMFVQPTVVNTIVQPVKQSTNGSFLHENIQKNLNEFTFHEKNNNKLITEGTISPRYTIQNNSFHNQPNGLIQQSSNTNRLFALNQIGSQKQHIVLSKQKTKY